MGHHKVVLQVKLTQFKKVIGEGLPFGKVLLKRAEAAIHRVAPGINNFSVGQNGFNKTRIGKVVGHFVGKERAATPMSLGLRQVLLAQLR